MKSVLSTARRKAAASQWVCLSCRGIRHASTSSGPSYPPKRYTSPSAHSLELRRSGPARTRFAPSPTGYLHLGSLRTALFNYMIAKATGGQFLLRIEDTDQKRTVHDAEERLLQDLEWAGIEWDEGPKVGGPYGPYKQSQRTAIYREHTEQLLQSGNAYRCFCTPERLRVLADYRSKLGLPPDYDRTCAHIPKEESDDRAAHGEAHVVRLLVPDQPPPFMDLVYGVVKRKGLSKTPNAVFGRVKGDQGSYDDPILLKSDGFPTYHLANVVDDHLMKITHVIRGSEWMSSTPKHVAMYEAFGWNPPQFAHVGLLLDKDRQKLSKRLESMSISELRDKGVFPETLTNFVALLGWSHNFGNDAMSLENLIRNASLKFTRGDTVVDFGKLWYLQKQHARRYASSPASSNPLHDLNELALKPVLRILDHNEIHHSGKFEFYGAIPKGAAREEYVRGILWGDAKKYTNPIEFIERNAHFWVAPNNEALIKNNPAMRLHNVPAIAAQPTPGALTPFFSSFSEIPKENWNTAEIKSWILSIVEQASSRSFEELARRHSGWTEEDTDAARKQWSKAWNKLVHQYLRWALMAAMPGPDGAETMRILGRDETLQRLEAARELMLMRAELEHKEEAEERRKQGDARGKAAEVRRNDSVADDGLLTYIMASDPGPVASSRMDEDGGAEAREVDNAVFWEPEQQWDGKQRGREIDEDGDEDYDDEEDDVNMDDVKGELENEDEDKDKDKDKDDDN